MKYTISIHKDTQEGGFWGECLELPGCYSQGESVEDLMNNIREAVELYLEDEEEIYFPVAEVRELIL
ncbi:MAG: type II toxin-antitoxin system HicB family antitoxin [Synergistaceae bacterium]|nr:type II toxin-antitoxin system HicB family antitoxin [Synergistaceae bacterium]